MHRRGRGRASLLEHIRWVPLQNRCRRAGHRRPRHPHDEVRRFQPPLLRLPGTLSVRAGARGVCEIPRGHGRWYVAHAGRIPRDRVVPLDTRSQRGAWDADDCGRLSSRSPVGVVGRAGRGRSARRLAESRARIPLRPDRCAANSLDDADVGALSAGTRDQTTGLGSGGSGVRGLRRRGEGPRRPGARHANHCRGGYRDLRLESERGAQSRPSASGPVRSCWALHTPSWICRHSSMDSAI